MLRLHFRVEYLDQTLERLKKDDMRVTDELRSVLGGKLKFALIEGPDRIRIEVLDADGGQ